MTGKLNRGEHGQGEGQIAGQKITAASGDEGDAAGDSGWPDVPAVSLKRRQNKRPPPVATPGGQPPKVV